MVLHVAPAVVFAEKGHCSCGHARLDRFVDATGRAGRCPDCEEPIQASSFFSHAEVPSALLDRYAHFTLGALGHPSRGAVVVRTDERTVMIRGGEA